MQKFDKPLSEATTSSLEALKALSLADAKHNAGDELAALPLYQRATELDPNFAMAYARLGSVYSNLGQNQASEQNRQKAFELRDRTSEHEKLYIMSHYYGDSGQLEKGITALELYKQTYPRDSIPYNNISAIYNQLGQFENALDNARQSVQLDPDSASGYANVAEAYMGLNRLDEAKAILNQGLERKLNPLGNHLQLAAIAWVQNDAAEMEKHLEAAKQLPGGDMTVSGTRSAIAACRGQIKAARDFGQKSREAAERLGLKEVAGSEYSQEALMEATVLNKSRAVEDAAQSVKISQSPIAVLTSALALAVAGGDKKAEDLANSFAQKRPYDTFVQFVGAPAVHAQLQLNHNGAAKAIDLLDNAMVYARANTTVLYFRGNAYLKAGRGTDAVQAFQRMLEVKGFAGIDPLMPLANLGLARAYALAGDKARSRVAYQDFLGLWKDADSDLPLLREAKVEYAKVQ